VVDAIALSLLFIDIISWERINCGRKAYEGRVRRKEALKEFTICGRVDRASRFCAVFAS
jgi:hypothetical protein